MERLNLNPDELVATLWAWCQKPQEMAAEAKRRAATIVPLVKIGHEYYKLPVTPDGVMTVRVHWPEDAKHLAHVGEKVTELMDTVLYAHDFMTHHQLMNGAVFAPTWAEVLMQIPDELLERATAFHVKGKVGWHGSNRFSGEVELLGPKRIPQISDEELRRRADRIRPVVNRDGLRFMEEPNLRTSAFTWEPKLTEPATQLVEAARIRTYHTYGYQGYFKPSIAEVLAQIPAEHLDTMVAFETLGPSSIDDLNRDGQELDEGYHVAETVLYRPVSVPVAARHLAVPA